MRYVRHAIVCLALTAAGSGCRHARPCPPPYEPSPFRIDLPTATPGPLPVTVAAKAPADVAPTYRRLTEADCLTLAVRNCGPAQRLDREQHDVVNAGKPACETKAKADALGHAADELRNRAGGEALDLYWKLVAAEAGRQIFREAAADLAKLLDDATRATNLGVKEPENRAELENQLAETRAEVAKLDGSIHELNHGLKALLGLDADPTVQLWPDAPAVAAVDLDVDKALATALTYRPDILLPKTLNASPDSLAPQIARQLLGGSNPLLGIEPGTLPPGLGPIGRTLAGLMRLNVPGPGDAAQTRRQVAGLVGDRESLAAAEVRSAADRVAAGIRRSVIERDAVESLGKRVADFERAKDAGRPVTVPLANARAAWHRARGRLVVAATETRAAAAKFRQAQGLLVRDVMDPAFAAPPSP